MPAAGSILLKSITYNGSKTFKFNGGGTIPSTDTYSVDRTTQGYFHFEPIELSSLRIVLESQVYISALKCLALGINKIIGELNTYASKSYIGYKVEYPDETSSLKKIQITPAGYSKNVDNVRLKLYDNLNDFNAMNNNYIISGSNIIVVDVSKAVSPSLYVLVELESVNNTTPCVGQVKLTFE